MMKEFFFYLRKIYELGDNLWCMGSVFEIHSTIVFIWNSKIVSILNKKYENKNEIKWQAFRQILMRSHSVSA